MTKPLRTWISPKLVELIAVDDAEIGNGPLADGDGGDLPSDQFIIPLVFADQSRIVRIAESNYHGGAGPDGGFSELSV